jgi:hypothetical protein
MAINTQKFLPSSKGGALAKVAKISKGSVAVISEKSQQNIGIIKVKVIEIDKLLKGTVASQKKALDIKRKEGEKKRFSELETKLETKPKAEKGKIKMPKLPRMGFLDWIKNFIGNIILGYFAVRLVDQLPKLKGVISFIGAASDFVLDIGGKLLDGLVTFIDWGYKAYDATRGFMKNLFGEGGVKQFDQLSGLLNKFLNLAIIVGMIAASGNGFGGGGRGRGGGSRFKPGQGGRSRVTTSGGRGLNRPDIRNPFRERPTITTGRSGGFRLPQLPGTGAKVTGGGKGFRLPSGASKILGVAGKSLGYIALIPLVFDVVGSIKDGNYKDAARTIISGGLSMAVFNAVLGASGAAAVAGALFSGGTLTPVAIATLLGGAALATGASAGTSYASDELLKKLGLEDKPKRMAGGGTAKGKKRRTLNTKKGKYKRKLAPRKPGQIQMQPGADVGGEDKLFGLFPNPLKTAQNAIDMMNPFKVIENTGKELGKSDYFGPILAITSKILLGQKPNQKDYENVGLGINLLVSKGLNEGQLKGGLAAFAEGGFVDPKTLDAISQGGDITNWVAKAFKDSTESNTQETLRDIQDNLRLKKERPTGPDSDPTLEDDEGGPDGMTEGKWGPLLDLIAGKESGGNYEAMYPSTTLKGATKMTIAEVAKRATGAVGKYQQLPQYLVGRAKAAGLDPNKDLYSPENQEKIIINVNIKGRGGERWLKGEISDEQFMQGLSQEFASLPNANNQFYYPGQRSAMTADKVKSALSKVKKGGYAVGRRDMSIAGMDKGGVGGTLSQYITGDPNTPFGRFDRAGHGTPGNYHDHLAFKDKETAQRAFNFFKSKGFTVTELNVSGGHSPGSLHYSGRAFDIPGSQWKGSGAIGQTEYNGSAKVRATLKQFLGGSSSPTIAKAYGDGGITPNYPHLAILGDKKQEEIVVDGNSVPPARDMLLAINQAKDHKGVMKAIQQYAPYDAMSPQTIVMPSSGGESDYDTEMGGGGVMMMDVGGGDSYDPFDALEMGG